MALTATAKVLGPTQGDTGWLGSIGVRFMIDGALADQRFSLVEHPMPPRALAAPLHRHTHEDEYSYVVEGRMGATAGWRWRPPTGVPTCRRRTGTAAWRGARGGRGGRRGAGPSTC